MTSWTVDHQTPLSMEFSRPEYWSGLTFYYLEDLPNPGFKPRSSALQAGSSLSEPLGTPTRSSYIKIMLATIKKSMTDTDILAQNKKYNTTLTIAIKSQVEKV